MPKINVDSVVQSDIMDSQTKEKLMKEQMIVAAELAVKYHEGQEYGDSGLPYFYHLKCVDDLVIIGYTPKDLTPSQPYSSHPGSEIDKLRAIALLHDILEDTDATTTDLSEAGICDDVLLAVVAITKFEGESYEGYINAVLENPLALKVKIADTATNLAHSVLDGNQKRIAKYSRQLNLLKGFETL